MHYYEYLIKEQKSSKASRFVIHSLADNEKQSFIQFNSFKALRGEKKNTPLIKYVVEYNNQNPTFNSSS